MITVDSVFETRNLVASVNQINVVNTPVLDKVFKQKDRSLSSNIQFDIETKAQGIQVSVPSGSPAVVTSKKGYKTIIVPAPRFPEKTPIKPSELDGIRAMGSNAPMLMAEKVGKILANQKARTDRTREFMAVRALHGKVVDGAGKVLVEFTLPEKHKPVLTGKNKWNDDESKVLKFIRDWKKLITQATGGAVAKFQAFCSSDVMDALLEHPKVVELLKSQMGKELAEEGRICRIGGVDVEEILGAYVDEDEVVHDMMEPGMFCLVGIGHGNTAEGYAPPEDLKAPHGLGTGKLPEVYFAKSWEEEDPSVRWIKSEACPLPLVKRPGCIVAAKVI